MDKRSRQLSRFLTDLNLQNCKVESVAGDASARRYLRIFAPRGSVILMDADPGLGENVARFADLADHLIAHGLSAPRIFARDDAAGFLVTEDFGSGVFAAMARNAAVPEKTLYRSAVDVLLHLRNVPFPERPIVSDYTAFAMAQATDLAFDWYLAPLIGDAAKQLKLDVQHAMQNLLTTAIGDTPPVLCLRDFHAENLLWLKDRSGVRRAGIIDFQDAVAAHPAYDLVSLLQDARRDVSCDIVTAMIDHYTSHAAIDKHQFLTAYAALGVQRNLRILGIFARLAKDRNKPSYLDLIPRTHAHLVAGLRHPALAPIADLLLPHLPTPEQQREFMV
jgi:aminoglycoside/choline kinase family phosphotransferase